MYSMFNPDDGNRWGVRTGQDFVTNHESPDIDYAVMHQWWVFLKTFSILLVYTLRSAINCAWRRLCKEEKASMHYFALNPLSCFHHLLNLIKVSLAVNAGQTTGRIRL